MKLSNIFFSLNEYKVLLKRLLVPNEIYDGVEDIQLQKLYSQGRRAILLDVDNTIMTYREETISLEKERWVEMVKSMGFDVYLISNNSSKRRIENLAKKLGLQGLYFTLKPFSFSTREFIQKKGIETKELIVIGDQILTDVIYGNWIRAHTILVDPLDKKLSFLKTMQKQIERHVLAKVEGFPG